MFKVSVIVPVYNAERYLRKCVDSILAQTLPKDEYEIILVDDGSTDKSPAICDEYTKQKPTSGSSLKGRESFASVWGVEGRVGDRPHIRVIHQANQGVAMARNIGIKASNGEFVAFLDADDWWAPTYLEQMLQVAADYPQAGIIGSNYVKVRLGREQRFFDDVSTGYVDYFALYTTIAQPLWTGSVLVRRSALRDVEEAGCFFKPWLKLGEDFDLWVRLSLTTKVAFLNKDLAYYNNDVSPATRATGHLHAPKHHMLWNLEPLTQMVRAKNDASQLRQWQRLIDVQRIYGLMPYYLSKEYHDAAAYELSKVQWTDELSSSMADYKRLYRMPIGLLRIRHMIFLFGSMVKKRILKLIRR